MNENKENMQEQDSLDSLERVKTLSPNMMVVKRFFRNKLAIVGLGILLFIVLFSFVGGLVSPYGESQVFRKTEVLKKDYAGATLSSEKSIILKDGYDYKVSDINMAILEQQINTEELSKINEENIFVQKLSEQCSIVSKAVEIGTANETGVAPLPGVTFAEDVAALYTNAMATGQTSFAGMKKYGVFAGKLYELEDIAVASDLVYSTFTEEETIGYDFAVAAENAMVSQLTSFAVADVNYEVEYNTNNETTVFYKNVNGARTEYAMLSKYIVTSVTKEFLDVQFKYDVIEAIQKEAKSFTSKDIKGKKTKFYLIDNNDQFTIKREKATQVNDSNAAPSAKHWVGTDSHGMDLLTRLMYGGRVSILIGFIVVALEMIIGVVLGGLAGYFGKWVDTLIMRIVEVFNCIPTMPLFIIIGTILDARKVDPSLRIYFLALVLAAFYWTGVARMVRGQILSLREQEFMVATEAMGIRTSKRIFKHLIPNVLPQLIVMATMDLGGIILTEASLSFLGLGVKFPLASWGQIINAVNDMQTMTTYWWVWIPAGMCILLTVLGFNFVGDGLRDAFDPKMKW